MRHLAEELASAGFPVLRFDYHGTGDSFGDEREPERVATWCADIVRAADELRALSGVRRVTLIGLGLGATLAAFVAPDREDVPCVVLWAPYDSGSTFVSEVTKAHKLHMQHEPESFSGGPVEERGEEARGFFLTAATLAELGTVDLLSILKPPACDMMVIGTERDHLVEHLRGLGCKVKHRNKPGHSFLFPDPLVAKVPHDIIKDIIAYLSEVFPPLLHDSPSFERSPPLTRPMGSERPAIFGAQHALFGILTEACDREVEGEFPGIIMLNAGGLHRIGPNRLSVTMARRLARTRIYSSAPRSVWDRRQSASGRV